jgi:localization factor PodJL
MATQRDAPQESQTGWSRDFTRDYEAAFGHHPGIVRGAATRPTVIAHGARSQHAVHADGVSAAVDQMAAEMQARIADVEQRHADALRDMQIKLERMSGEAVRARATVPSELTTAFNRIEQGMAHLADRVAETAQPRKRGAEKFVFAAPKTDATHFVFSPKPHTPVAPVSLEPPGGHDPWDNEQAEALAGLYESGAAGFGASLPGAALFAHVQPAAPVASQPAPAMLAAPGDSRAWLEDRLAGLTEQVAKSIEAARPGAALETLMERVDQLEARFGTALDGLATKADLKSLKPSAALDLVPDALLGLEAQIKELTGHFEVTEQQLGRLDMIEQQLADLHAFAQASLDAEPAAVGHTASVEDLERLADLAVERLMARYPVADRAAAPAVGETDGAALLSTHARIDAVHGLLNEFAVERRKGDAYTTGMLETVQEALVRLIDRVDAIDAAQAVQATQGTQRTQVTEAVPVASALEEPSPVRARAQRAPRDPAPPVVPPEPPAAVEPAQASPARRRREVRAAEAPPPPADLPSPPADELAAAQAEISINDLKLNELRGKQRRVPIEPAPEPKPDVKPEETADEPTTQAAAQPTKRRPRPVQQRGIAGKYGTILAMVALGLVGIYVGSLILSDRFGTPLPGAPSAIALPKAAPALPGAATAPASTPPGLVRPGQPPQGAQGPVLRDQNGVPQPRINLAPPPRPQAAPGQADQPPPTKPGQPASVPDTISDDLSQLDVDSPMADALPSAAEAVPATPDGNARQGAFKPMPGMSFDTTQLARLTSGPTGAQRQAAMAVASERAGAATQQQGDFGGRFGAFAQPAPVAPPPPAPSRITTGSNPEVTTLAKPASYGAAPATPQAPIDTAVTENVNEAVEMPPALIGPLSLRMAAAKGDASAAFEVATRFAEGRGIKQDFKQAMTWYQRSAAKGLAVAQYRLGTLYERGLGTPVDAARARIWYKRAAEQGNVKAMHNMAVLSAGNGQTQPDYVAAAKWFKDAAERGLADSQFNLGVLNENGLGIPKDLRSAYLWFALAARGGDVEAARRRDQLLAQLDANTLKAVDDQIRAWRAKPTDNRINDARVAGDQWRSQAAGQQEPMALPQPVPPPQPPQAVQPAAQPGVSATPAAVTPRSYKVPAR